MALVKLGPESRPKKRSLKLALAETLLALFLVGGAAFGLASCTIETGTGGATTTTGLPLSTVSTVQLSTTTSTSADEITGGGLASPAEPVAAKLGPSVVNVAVSGTVAGVFGRQQYSAEGSGVIYRSDGMIITNNHVVTDDNGDPVQNIQVTLATGEKLSAALVGRDPYTDLAVIKVQANRPLPAAEFETNPPAVGEYAIAIGSPLGYENSVTLGIVSGLGRSIEGVPGPEGIALTNLIQTDAPISPGNSGGALANAQGKVIGINVAYLPPGQTGAVNIGFAIPAVVVKQVADEIIQTGKVTHAYIGIGPQTVTPELQQQFGLSRSSGVLVAEVAPNGPAQKAGIRQGDIILKIDSTEMKQASDLLVAVRDKKPGDKVRVTLDRNGQEMVVTVTLEERPANL